MAFQARQDMLKMTELQLNWQGRSWLNPKESDLQYKHHVYQLSKVYRGHSKVDNTMPRSIARPPPWAAPISSLVKTPIKGKKAKETGWDNHFGSAVGGCDTRKSIAKGRSKAANNGSSTNSSGNRMHDFEGRAEWAATRQRPASAGARDSCAMKGGQRGRKRPASATVRRGAPTRTGREEAGPKGGVTSCESPKGEGLSEEDMQILHSSFRLSSEQQKVYDDFTALLAGFDPVMATHVLEDVFKDAKARSLMSDYTGTGG